MVYTTGTSSIASDILKSIDKIVQQNIWRWKRYSISCCQTASRIDSQFFYRMWRETLKESPRNFRPTTPVICFNELPFSVPINLFGWSRGIARPPFMKKRHWNWACSFSMFCYKFPSISQLHLSMSSFVSKKGWNRLLPSQPDWSGLVKIAPCFTRGGTDVGRASLVTGENVPCVRWVTQKNSHIVLTLSRILKDVYKTRIDRDHKAERLRDPQATTRLLPPQTS